MHLNVLYILNLLLNDVSWKVLFAFYGCDNVGLFSVKRVSEILLSSHVITFPAVVCHFPTPA